MADAPAEPVYDGALFNELRAGAGTHWTAYVGHDFVRQLGFGKICRTRRSGTI